MTLRKDDDLFELSGGRDVYQGWTVEDIHAGGRRARVVEFGNGRTVRGGAASAGARTTSTSG